MFSGLKVIMDFIPNHTSDQHPWFRDSVTQANMGRKNDWYIWKKPKYSNEGKRNPPNNWVSRISLNTHPWSSDRSEVHSFLFYYHPQRSAERECFQSCLSV